ncbi:MAG TPA: hypothetical protein V6C65_40840 [Allocoleopsis sp.]
MTIRSLDWGTYCGQTIRIYRNLNNGTMSIQAKVDKSWKVVGHVTDCVVSDVSFKIQDGGRQRVIREGRKNVHAWGQGVLVCQFDSDIFAPIDLSYNPYEDTTFKQRHTDNPIVSCRYLVVRDNKVFVSPDAVQSPVSEGKRSMRVRSSPILFTFAFAAA